MRPGPLPWALTFSYGRALQEDALSAWGGKPAGFSGGQKALFVRAKLNGLAAVGAYKRCDGKFRGLDAARSLGLGVLGTRSPTATLIEPIRPHR